MDISNLWAWQWGGRVQYCWLLDTRVTSLLATWSLQRLIEANWTKIRLLTMRSHSTSWFIAYLSSAMRVSTVQPAWAAQCTHILMQHHRNTAQTCTISKKLYQRLRLLTFDESAISDMIENRSKDGAICLVVSLGDQGPPQVQPQGPASTSPRRSCLYCSTGKPLHGQATLAPFGLSKWQLVLFGLTKGRFCVSTCCCPMQPAWEACKAGNAGHG